MSLEIQPIRPEDVNAFFDHMERLVAENGNGATPIFMNAQPESYERQPRKALEAWARPLDRPGWIRNWVVWDDGRIIAHVQLDSGGSAGASHRAGISIAIEKRYRRKGLGKRMMAHALDWASGQARFDWIDLSVFANNHPAISLYEKLGFQRTGVRRDALRLRDERLDEIHMSLSLKT